MARFWSGLLGPWACNTLTKFCLTVLDRGEHIHIPGIRIMAQNRKSNLGRGNIDLKELKKRFRKVDETEDDDDMSKCSSGSACEDHISTVGDSP